MHVVEGVGSGGGMVWPDQKACFSIRQDLSNSLLKEIAAGLPVIAYDSGGNLEAVLDGESGPLFPVGASQRLAVLILLLIRHPAFCERMGESAVETIRKESPVDTMARSHEQMYNAFARNCAA
jgi:glycosyltransferase involved in cell wall biosynthesis